jgi:nucleotide-binding universal stress UspA family protein
LLWPRSKMFIKPCEQPILCLTACDQDSLLVLERARALSSSLGCPLHVIVVVPEGTPRETRLEASWFQRWAEQGVGLQIAREHLTLCLPSELSRTLEAASSKSFRMLVCPPLGPDSSEFKRVDFRALWACAARLEVPLLVARRTVQARRILAVSDNTARTLPVLTAAFELAGSLDAPLSYVEAMRVRMANVRDVLPPKPRQAARSGRKASHAAHALTLRSESEPPPIHGLAKSLVRAGYREQADVLVVGVCPSDPDIADDILRSAPCSVLAVPCAAPR